MKYVYKSLIRHFLACVRVIIFVFNVVEDFRLNGKTKVIFSPKTSMIVCY